MNNEVEKYEHRDAQNYKKQMKEIETEEIHIRLTFDIDM